ncbi:hypothetical protein KFL_003380120 [Klebsormidium nitens]|uniref:Dirigent protein n=1 Tax=Klebsormidium nitens TaxID=105231 RepID=A0A1Y1IES1_KLENI|nr:hypothetical protein KFL_003380120 [Klebsormidium nitens]|eukprot:GAQ87207.1 hypothetical protein KFL_003380120 [Klebsormidium nitens]
MARSVLLALLLVAAVSHVCLAAGSNCNTGSNSVNPNACYSVSGDFFECCPGGCSSSPQANVACPAIHGGSNTLPGTPSLQFIEYATEATQTIVGDPTVPGTVLKFRNEVRSLDGTTIGYTLGSCAYSVGLQADQTFEGLCFYSIHLGADLITAAGKLTSANVADLEVTGGYGIYSGARGRIVLTTISTSDMGGAFGDFQYQIYTVAPSPFPQPNTAQYSKDQLLATEGIPPVLPSSQGPASFEVREIQNSETSQAAGALLIFRNNLFSTSDNSTAIGFDIGTCVYLVGPLDDGKFELICLDTIHIGADYLVIYGIYTSKNTQVVAIIGGAGQYEKAKGSVEITTLSGSGAGEGLFSYKFFLK